MSFVYFYLIPLIICVLTGKFYKDPEIVFIGFIPVFNIIPALICIVYFAVERTITWVEK